MSAESPKHRALVPVEEQGAASSTRHAEARLHGETKEVDFTPLYLLHRQEVMRVGSGNAWTERLVWGAYHTRLLMHHEVNIQRILQHHPDIAGAIFFDEMRQLPRLASNLVFRFHGAGESHFRMFDDVDDYFIATLRAWLLEIGIQKVTLQEVATAVDVLARANRQNPIRTTLQNLEWDGKPRLNTWLTDYCGADDHTIHRLWGAHWMIGAVARIFEPGCKMDQMLILYGPQGIGKSSLFRLLAGEQYFGEELPFPKDKDAKLLYYRNWINEFAEVERFMRSAESGALKAFVTVQTDQMRLPYSRKAQTFKRTFVLCGTTNEQELLRDPTGARRYPIVGVTRVDLERIERDRGQLWAEAAARYRAGESWYLADKELQRQAAELQEMYQERDPWHDTLTSLAIKTDTITIDDALSENGVNVPLGQRNNQHRARVRAILKDLGMHERRPKVAGVKQPSEFYWPEDRKTEIVQLRKQNQETLALRENRDF